jgi:hypothetical protein
MRTAVKVAFEATLILAIGFVGCTSSKSIARKEGIAELQRMRSAVQDMNIVVSAGVTNVEYSRRLTDALLKFGGQDGGCKQAVQKFQDPEQQSFAAEACQPLSTAMIAYTNAKEYVSPKTDPIDPEFVIYTLPDDEYRKVRETIPTLAELPVSETNQDGYKFYRRRDMVQALWKVAGQEYQLAEAAIEKLGPT